MKTILSKELNPILVDDEDFDWLSKFIWTTRFKGGYALCSHKEETGRWRLLSMHRIIMGSPERKFDVDHINFDKLDNRRENLRLLTRSQNKLHTRANPLVLIPVS
jgi:hypothetical protein